MSRDVEPNQSVDESTLPFWLESLLRFGTESSLSPREQEIMGVMIKEITQSEDIALELSISTHTVNNHLKNIFEKTKTRSKTDVLAKFFAFATRDFLKTSPSAPLSRPLTIQVVTPDPAYGSRLGNLLQVKGASTLIESPLKEDLQPYRGDECDWVIKPIVVGKNMSPDIFQPTRQMRTLYIQLVKNPTTSSEKNEYPSMAPEPSDLPELFAMGCVGSVSLDQPVEEAAREIEQIIVKFNRVFRRPATHTTLERQVVGPIELPLEALGRRGVFLSQNNLGKSKIQWQLSEAFDLRFYLPGDTQNLLQASAIAVWKRSANEMGKTPGIGLWFHSFANQENLSRYQDFVQNQNLPWAIPPATDHFDLINLQQKSIRMPAGA